MSYDVEFCVCWFSIKVLGFTVTVCGVSAHMKTNLLAGSPSHPYWYKKGMKDFQHLVCVNDKRLPWILPVSTLM